MYPFERYMKVLKGYVRNRNRPEGSIAEGYIVEEAIEFCTGFCQDNMSIGLGKAKERDQNDDIGRPSSAASHIRPEKVQLMQAHLYVLENTNDVQPYIEKHMDHLKKIYLSKAKHLKWLKDKHNQCFISWVATELESPNNTISDTLRWISHGPSSSVITYTSYVMNGIRYNTEHRDGVRNVQNSGVCLVANTMQISSAKDKHPIVTNMSFYGVIQEIWELNYINFKIIMFKCNWVDSVSGARTDELGFTLVNLKRIGHKTDSFILASQAKQVFFLEDPSDSQWHVVLMDCCSDDHLSVGVDEDVAHVDCFLETSSQRSMCGPTTMIHLTQISSDANRLVVDYNERGEWIGENVTQMKSFVTNPKSKKDILKKAGSAFRNFKSILRNNYIFPYIDEPECLKFPPPNYSTIDLSDWETFVSLSMSEDFLKRSNMQKERRKNYKYNHRTSRKGYANLEEELDKLQKDVDKTYSVSDDILTQALRTPEHRGRVRGVGGLITPLFYFYKHIPSEPRETHITVDVDANWKKEKSQILSEYSQMAKQTLKSLKRNRETSLDAHSGCNQNISEKQFISMSNHHTEKIDLGRPCSLAVGKVDNIVSTGTVFERISTNEIVYGVRLGEGDVRVLIELACDSHSLLPIPVVGSIYFVHDAIGSHVPWPKYLIVIEKQKNVKFKFQNMHFCIRMFSF
ncbi:hypothetical protein IC582_028551 [Cucumis melo]